MLSASAVLKMMDESTNNCNWEPKKLKSDKLNSHMMICAYKYNVSLLLSLMSIMKKKKFLSHKCGIGMLTNYRRVDCVCCAHSLKFHVDTLPFEIIHWIIIILGGFFIRGVHKIFRNLLAGMKLYSQTAYYQACSLSNAFISVCACVDKFYIEIEMKLCIVTEQHTQSMHEYKFAACISLLNFYVCFTQRAFMCRR